MIKQVNIHMPPQLLKKSVADLVSGLADCPRKIAQISSPENQIK
jgi:hypothetical protein